MDNKIMFNPIDLPEDIEMFRCLDCKKEGGSEELKDSIWDQSWICPFCGSDETELFTLEYDLSSGKFIEKE